MSFIVKLLQNSSVGTSLLLPKTLAKTLSTASYSICSKLFSNNQNLTLSAPIIHKQQHVPLLSIKTGTNVCLQQTRGYKQKLRLRKRCRNCYFVWRNGRLYVECTEHPRHKQHHVDSMVRGFDNIPHGYVKGDVKC